MLEREETLKLVILNLSAVVLVDLGDQSFDIDGHLELFLDNINQLSSVNAARLVRIPSKRHIRIECVLLVRLVLEFSLLSNHSLKLGQTYLSGILRVRLGHHSL